VPGEEAGKAVKPQPKQNSPSPQTISAPLTPSEPVTTNAQLASNEKLEGNVRKLKDRIHAAEKWMIWLTGVIAFFALCQVIAAILQWSAMEGQLAEMRSQLELTDRAWVEFSDASVADKLRDGLSFQPNRFLPDANPQAILRFEVAYKNVGHSAAFGVKISSELYLMRTETYSNNGVVEAEEKRFCSLPIKETSVETSGKSTLFPEQASSSNQMDRAEINANTSFDGKDLGKVVLPVLIVCADYQYQASTVHHQTRAAYDLWPVGTLPDIPRPHFFGIWTIDPDGTKTPTVLLQRIEADDYAD